MRVATWNTLWRFGDWEARQPLLAASLVALRADVVLLQETWPAQANALAEATGLELLGFGGGYFDQTLSTVPDDEQFGNAILARTGTLVVDQAFASEGDPAPRRLLAAEVGDRVFATVHLSHIAGRGEVRAAQLTEIVGCLAEQGRSFVLGGDCNMVPSSAEYQSARELGLVDVWNEHHTTDPGPTMVPANPEISHTAWMDDRNDRSVPPGTGVRFDYLWTHGDIDVQSVERFGDVAGPRWPSDHLGLVAEL